jgi:hypothetical protein
MSATPSRLDLESGVVGVDKHATRQRRVKLGTSCVRESGSVDVVTSAAEILI